MVKMGLGLAALQLTSPLIILFGRFSGVPEEGDFFEGGMGGKMRVAALEVAGPQYLEDVDMAEQVVWHSYTTQIYLQIIR